MTEPRTLELLVTMAQGGDREALGELFERLTPRLEARVRSRYDDGGVDLSDAVHLLAFLFTGGPAPAAPTDGCEHVLVSLGRSPLF